MHKLPMLNIHFLLIDLMDSVAGATDPPASASARPTWPAQTSTVVTTTNAGGSTTHNFIKVQSFSTHN